MRSPSSVERRREACHDGRAIGGRFGAAAICLMRCGQRRVGHGAQGVARVGVEFVGRESVCRSRAVTSAAVAVGGAQRRLDQRPAGGGRHRRPRCEHRGGGSLIGRGQRGGGGRLQFLRMARVEQRPAASRPRMDRAASTHRRPASRCSSDSSSAMAMRACRGEQRCRGGAVRCGRSRLIAAARRNEWPRSARPWARPESTARSPGPTASA